MENVRRKLKSFFGGALGGYDRVAMVGIVFVVLALLVIMMWKSHTLSVTLEANNARIVQLTDQIKDERDRTEQIKQLKVYMQTPEYAELMAREKLGMVKDNEIVFEEAP